MKKLFLILSVAFLMGCEQEPPSHIQGGQATDNNLKYQINYFKDTRTGLCFAETGGTSDSHTLTCVPCNEAVENLIGN